MRGFHPSLAPLLFLFGGVSALVVVKLWPASKQPVRAAIAAPEERRIEPPVADPEMAAEVRTLASRVRALEQRTREASTPPPASSGSDLQPARETQDEAAARASAEHRAAIEAHDREMTDPVWASKTEDAYKQGLDTISRLANFTVNRVDCRSRTCTADLQFASYGVAMSNWPKLMSPASYPVGCGISVLCDKPSDVDAPYQTTVVFSCPDGGAAPHSR